MIAQATPEKYKAEEERIFSAWMDIDDDVPIDEFVRQNASAAYRKYYFDYQERKRRLRARGIIVN